METVEDILRDMEETARMYLAGGNYSVSVFEILSSYADRLDAAYMRSLKAKAASCESDIRRAMDEVAKLREENAKLTEAMSSVVGCADSTCGEMGVCRTCKVAQYTGGAK